MTNHLPAILEANTKHPEWSSKEVALHLGISWGHVRKIGVDKALRFASGTQRGKLVPGLKGAKAKP